MKHVSLDKYNLAWFKLAECVARGEKERALGVYRLLSHSFDDPAFACQLEGDILLLFDETDDAINKYCQAAGLYKKNKRHVQAAAVYEHLLTLKPDSLEYRQDIVDLYKQLRIASKVKEQVSFLFDQAIKTKKLDEAAALADEWSAIGTSDQIAHVYEMLIFAILDTHQIPPENIYAYIEKALDHFLDCDGEVMLQQFLSKLQVINVACHKHAIAYIEAADINKDEKE